MENEGDNLYFIGVDVGTASVRAALVNSQGHIKSKHHVPIQINNPQPEFYEQSSSEIWEAVCRAVKEVTKSEKVSNHQIKGIGFDATCSLVTLQGDLLSFVENGNENLFTFCYFLHPLIRRLPRRITEMGCHYVDGSSSQIGNSFNQ